MIVIFQYEQLFTFCFFCGIIEHSEQFCDLLYDDPDAEKKAMSFDLKLRANNKKGAAVDDSRWIGRRASCSM